MAAAVGDLVAVSTDGTEEIAIIAETTVSNISVQGDGGGIFNDGDMKLKDVDATAQDCGGLWNSAIGIRVPGV